MATDKIISKKEDGIGSLIFNNPARHNAISLEMVKAASEVITDFGNDPKVRVIVLSGAGGKSFISGADISKFEDDRSTAEAAAVYASISNSMKETLRTVGKPTIAMIRGWCLGGGLAVALNCDLRICSDESRFGVPAARLGIAYGMDGLRQLVRLVGPSTAKEFLFTAKRYTAEEALRFGLVNLVVAGDKLEETVRDYAKVMVDNAPLSILASKRIIDEIVKDAGERDMALCKQVALACDNSNDIVEGRRAFMAKRRPVFTGT